MALEGWLIARNSLTAATGVIPSIDDEDGLELSHLLAWGPLACPLQTLKKTEGKPWAHKNASHTLLAGKAFENTHHAIFRCSCVTHALDMSWCFSIRKNIAARSKKDFRTFCYIIYTYVFFRVYPGPTNGKQKEFLRNMEHGLLGLNNDEVMVRGHPKVKIDGIVVR